jgi:hypothetical protein
MPDLVVLVITACLSAASGGGAGQCNDHRVPLQDGITLRQCEMQGQIGLAQWAGEHPALRITRWRCVTPKTDRTPA